MKKLLEVLASEGRSVVISANGSLWAVRVFGRVTGPQARLLVEREDRCMVKAAQECAATLIGRGDCPECADKRLKGGM